MQSNDTAPRKRAPRRPPVQRNCEMCGDGFTAWQSQIDLGRGRYCSLKCSSAATKTSVLVPCEECGTLSEVKPSRLTNKRYHGGRYCSNRCLASAQAGDLAERVRRLTDPAGPGGCRDWRGNISRRSGYGYLTVRNKKRPAHRVALELAIGRPLVKGEVACHTCDRRTCIETSDIGVYVVDGVEYERRGHLWVGTSAANTRDMVLKGRSAVGDRHMTHIYPALILKGQRNPFAKLTDDDVREIRRRYAAGGVSQAQLAREYGVDQTTISKIVLRISWRHVA